MGYITRHTKHLNLGAARSLCTKGTDIFNFIGLVAWQGDLQQKTEPRRSITFEMQDGSLLEVMAWCRLAVICAVVWMIRQQLCRSQIRKTYLHQESWTVRSKSVCLFSLASFSKTLWTFKTEQRQQNHLHLQPNLNNP